jgi:hypothetical protein
VGERETARMQKGGESKTTRIMKATVRHVTSKAENFRQFNLYWTDCTSILLKGEIN